MTGVVRETLRYLFERSLGSPGERRDVRPESCRLSTGLLRFGRHLQDECGPSFGDLPKSSVVQGRGYVTDWNPAPREPLVDEPKAVSQGESGVSFPKFSDPRPKEQPPRASGEDWLDIAVREMKGSGRP